jgi:hypothetical protein
VSLWIVVGGQFGSEGKGKVSAHITCSEGIDLCVRCGGPNSGHSFLTENGSRLLLRQLPTGVVRPGTRLLIPAGISKLLDDLVLKGSFGKDRVASGPESKDSLKKQIDVRLKFPEDPPTTLLSVVKGELIANVERSMKSDPFRLGVPRSALLFGPPGTSKTGVANSIAEYVGCTVRARRAHL